MMSTVQWTDVLRQQYALVAESKDDLGLLLAVRRFVSFLETDPHARRYTEQMRYEWKTSYNFWLAQCDSMRKALSELEKGIKTLAAPHIPFSEDSLTLPPANTLPKPKRVFIKIAQHDWYKPWASKTDELPMPVLHIEDPPPTQTGYMIGHVLSITRQLTDVANEMELEKTALGLRNQAENLQARYRSAQWRVKNDWMASPIHALEQLRIAVTIMDGYIFIDPAGYDHAAIRSLSPWLLLMEMYAPPDLKGTFSSWATRLDTPIKDFRADLAPLIRSYTHRVFGQLLFLANSRLAHRQLVERYKVRCENYDWKQLAAMLQSHVEEVAERALQATKQQRHQFEDLLTLHLARYLHDNGYAVHYTPRHGVHEPDLLGALSNDLEPIVVEAKVVGQRYGTKQGQAWIEEGLRALLAYLQKYQNDYGVSDGYLIVFRVGDETSPTYTFEPAEWAVSGFTLLPRIINIGRINKKDPPIVIRQRAFLKGLGNNFA